MDSEQLKSARAGLNTSQQKIADALGLSWRQYIRYELGQSAIPGPVAKIVTGWTSGKWPRKPKQS